MSDWERRDAEAAEALMRVLDLFARVPLLTAEEKAELFPNTHRMACLLDRARERGADEREGLDDHEGR